MEVLIMILSEKDKAKITKQLVEIAYRVNQREIIDIDEIIQPIGDLRNEILWMKQ